MTARQKAERGIKASADNAGREWQDQAVAAARLFVRWNDRYNANKPFTIEALRLWCSPRIDAVSELRSWGAATRRLKSEGVIQATGRFAQAASSNLAPKKLYRRAS